MKPKRALRELPASRSFASRGQLGAWLKKNHAASAELWVQIFKKSSPKASVSWEDCVVVASTPSD